MKHGYGTEVHGSYTYEGKFINDKKDGIGKITYKNGSYYFGNWKEEMKHDYVK